MAEDQAQTGTTPPAESAPQPVQTELPIQTRIAAPAAPAPAAGPDPVKLAEMMADNKTMKAKIADLTAAQGQETQDRREAEIRSLVDKHKSAVDEATKAAELAMASARRNAVKAHFRGALKSDDYLGLVPAVQFTEDGDLTPESLEALDAFKVDKPELFTQASSATTPMSQSGANQAAHGFDNDTANALVMNKIALPGTEGHWQNRQNAGIMSQLVGHNSNAKPYGKVN